MDNGATPYVNLVSVSLCEVSLFCFLLSYFVYSFDEIQIILSSVKDLYLGVKEGHHSGRELLTQSHQDFSDAMVLFFCFALELIGWVLFAVLGN